MNLRATFDTTVDTLEAKLAVFELESDNRFKDGIQINYQKLGPDGPIAVFDLSGVPGTYPEFENFILELMNRRGFDPKLIEVRVSSDQDNWE